jgi:TPR repeat protein
MGNMLLEGAGIKRDVSKARNMFAISASHGHLYSLMKLADMTVAGLGSIARCKRAVELYKQITKMQKRENIYSTKQAHFNHSSAVASMNDAYAMFEDGDTRSAFTSYFHLGLMGHKIAQKNAAWILVQRLYTGASAKAQWSHRLKLAFNLYKRSGMQGSTESILRIGDMFYYGEHDQGVKPQLQRAAQYYRQASQSKSVEGYLNLGLMHGFGFGLARDIHLAKRNFDSAFQFASFGQKIAIRMASTFTWFYHYYSMAVITLRASVLQVFLGS